MDLTLLIQSATGLLALLAVLVMFLALSSKAKKKKKIQEVEKKTETQKARIDLLHLLSIIKKRKSTTEELKAALELVIKHHGSIHKKLGLRTHPDFDIYMDILFTICRHPNTSKDIIIKFDSDLERINPEYKPEINTAIAKGLNSRGA